MVIKTLTTFTMQKFGLHWPENTQNLLLCPAYLHFFIFTLHISQLYHMILPAVTPFDLYHCSCLLNSLFSTSFFFRLLDTYLFTYFIMCLLPISVF